jgi:hypothetical protein
VGVQFKFLTQNFQFDHPMKKIKEFVERRAYCITHADYHHLMDGNVTVEKTVVDRALRNFDRAMLDYYTAEGDYGPFFLCEDYSIDEYERLQSSIETSWKMGYLDAGRRIALFGDPNCVHGALAAFIVDDFTCALNQHVSDAPHSNVEAVDIRISQTGRYGLLVNRLDSPDVLLRRHPDNNQHVQFPSDRPSRVDAADGPVYKHPDGYFEIPAQYTHSGRRVIILFFEGAYRNESMGVLGWEVCRARAEGAVVSMGIKMNVCGNFLLLSLFHYGLPVSSSPLFLNHPVSKQHSIRPVSHCISLLLDRRWSCRHARDPLWQENPHTTHLPTFTGHPTQ